MRETREKVWERTGNVGGDGMRTWVGMQSTRGMNVNPGPGRYSPPLQIHTTHTTTNLHKGKEGEGLGTEWERGRGMNRKGED